MIARAVGGVGGGGVSGGGQPTAADLGPLQDRLGYTFRSVGILRQALTHSSASGRRGRGAPSNERLEFLGDRVLGLAISRLLFDGFPRDSVGDLARRHTALVRRETLARIAERLGLPLLIRFSRGEDEAGGRGNPALLADCGEAVLAAVYVDGGFDAAFAVIERLWRDLIDEMSAPPLDAKTALQEWAQARGLALPVYREAQRSGPDHAPLFSIEVSVAGTTPSIGIGASKRLAEQAAAEHLLARLRDTDPSA